MATPIAVNYGMEDRWRCDDCGRFMTPDGASWAAIYDMIGLELRHEHKRCATRTAKHGPVQSNARPRDGDMSPYQGLGTV